MIHKTIVSLVAVLMLLSVCTETRAQNSGLSSKSGNTTYKYGGQKKSGSNTNLFNKHQQFHNKYYKSHQDFNNKYYQPHPGTKAYNQKYYGNSGYEKKYNHNKHKNKDYYGYRPYGGYVYYGYNDYYYQDVPYDGYGSTLGTVPQRPSNLDVNNYVYGPDYENYGRGYYTEQQYEYPADYGYGPDGYSYDPPPERGTVYVWTDEYGVEHFVNDPELIPEQFSGDVRIVEEY